MLLPPTALTPCQKPNKRTSWVSPFWSSTWKFASFYIGSMTLLHLHTPVWLLIQEEGWIPRRVYLPLFLKEHINWQRTSTKLDFHYDGKTGTFKNACEHFIISSLAEGNLAAPRRLTIPQTPRILFMNITYSEGFVRWGGRNRTRGGILENTELHDFTCCHARGPPKVILHVNAIRWIFLQRAWEFPLKYSCEVKSLFES